MDMTEQTQTPNRSLGDATDARLNSALNSVGQGIAQLGSDLQSTDPRDVADDISAYARQNPVAFMAGAALLGFAAMRFAPQAAQKLDATADSHASSNRGGTL